MTSADPSSAEFRAGLAEKIAAEIADPSARRNYRETADTTNPASPEGIAAVGRLVASVAAHEKRH